MYIKKAIGIVLFVIILGLSSFTTHKFYVSVTQIDYNPEQQSLELISRIFIDDLENLLQERYDAAIVLGLEEETPNVNEYLKKYLDQKLKIKVNDKKVPITFLGKEYEDDLIVFYLEVEKVVLLERIAISNEILMDVFEEQQNIVHVKKEKFRKSLILEKGKSEGLLNFSE